MALLGLTPQVALSEVPTDELEDRPRHVPSELRDATIEPDPSLELEIARIPTLVEFRFSARPEPDEGDLRQAWSLLWEDQLEQASAVVKRLASQVPGHPEVRNLQVRLRCRVLELCKRSG